MDVNTKRKQTPAETEGKHQESPAQAERLRPIGEMAPDELKTLFEREQMF